jgi:hypothetical protein
MIQSVHARLELVKRLDAFFCYSTLGLEAGMRAYPEHLRFYLNNKHLSYEVVEYAIELEIAREKRQHFAY